MPLVISPRLTLPDHEVTLVAIRAQGAGGQNVNKVASAIHLRFDILASSLPEELKMRLLASTDSRISDDGVLVIKAQQFRTQEKNRLDAVERLIRIIRHAAMTPKKRTPTRPTTASRQRRLAGKTHRGQIKRERRRVDDE